MKELQNLKVHVFDKNSVDISNDHLNFYYTKADSVVKDEFKGRYTYFGGLQCNYNADSIEYKELEKNLCQIAENELSKYVKETNLI